MSSAPRGLPSLPQIPIPTLSTPWQEQEEILVRKMDFRGFVFVQATCHAPDNSVVVDALDHRHGRAAGLASATEDVSLDELKRLHAARVRGVRFAFLPHIASENTPAELIQRIAAKIEPLGWHTDLHFLPQTFDIMELLIRSLPTPVIIDHMGRPDVTVEVEKNGYFQRLLELGASRSGIYWKATSPDRYTRFARPQDWVVAMPFAHALLSHFPDRSRAAPMASSQNEHGHFDWRRHPPNRCRMMATSRTTGTWSRRNLQKLRRQAL